jgi:hypothetical protein
MRDDTHFHARPDRPGYERYDIELVSPELPSGAAWLANCLIELGVPVWKPWGSDDRTHWHALGDGRHRYVGGDNGWSRVLPALRHGREFRFGSTCVRVHHVWPDVYPAATHRLLFVRDPCDALYSAWRRQCATNPMLDFAAFCGGRHFHYPLSRVDYLLLFLRVWRRAAECAPVKVVRFEDYRRDAHATLDDVLSHLDIEAGQAQRLHALAASSVERAKEEDRRLLDLGVVDAPIVRGAAPGECARAIDGRLHARLRARFAELDAWLGYALSLSPSVPEHTRRARDEIDASVIDALVYAGIPMAADGWLAGVLHEALADIALVTKP